MNINSKIAISGDRTMKVTRGGSLGKPVSVIAKLKEIVRDALPFTNDEEVNRYRVRNFMNVMRGYRQIVFAKMFGVNHTYGALYAKVIRGDGSVLNLGLISLRVVTTAGVGFIVDAFQNSVEMENMKYHGFGIGTGAEASGDTALGTEFTTEYATDNVRPTGTTTEGASANIYRTVGAFTPNSGGVLAVTEHGVFSQAAVAGGVLLDRSKFAAVNLDSANGDSLQVTYEATFPAGS
ncbi:MAG: hypothetical protein IPG22_16650 [Acidobacteria bacterium]|nr:hypothetical protein [Acidobacteriota bacterium]